MTRVSFPLRVQSAFAVCPLYSVRKLLIVQYQKRLSGRNALRELLATQPNDKNGNPLSVVFYAIRQSIFPLREAPDMSDEERRAMVLFLVQEACANIWAKGHMDLDELRPIYGRGNQNWGHTFLPKHMAAFEVIKLSWSFTCQTVECRSKLLPPTCV